MAVAPWETDPTLRRKNVVALWLVLTIALIPAFLFIRAAAQEITQYHVNVFEKYARAAIAKGNYARAIELCTGTLKSSANRSDHWGKAYSLRAQAYAGEGNYRDALSELEAAAAFWVSRYYYASDDDRAELAHLGTDLGQKLLASENYEDALRAFSAAGLGSGQPVDYLYDLTKSIEPGQASKLWQNGPCLVVRYFKEGGGNLFRGLVEEQGRSVARSDIDPKGSLATGPSAYLELNPGNKEGRSLYGIDAYLPLSEKPFALRVFLKESPSNETKVALSYWFEAARKSAMTVDTATVSLPDGWRQFDITRNFYAERLTEANRDGYVITDGVINKISLDVPPGPACRFWVDRIELYLPGAAAPGT